MPKFNATQLEDYVRDRAPQIAHDIRTAAEKAHNEADLVAEVEKLLDRFDKNPDFDIQLHLERERTLINGRADAVYNRLVIEYEPPHSLQKTNSAHTNHHAIDQVKQYMGGLERLDRHKKERLAGVVLDGNFYIFIRHRDERWFVDDPLPVDTHSTQTFLRYLLSLSTELALTPDNLVRDFGANSNTARQVVPAIYKSIKETQNSKVKILFQQWRRQFQEVSGYDPSSGQLDTTEIGKEYAIKDKSPDLDRLFFAIHTYYATFIKLLALQVAYFYLMPKVGSGLASSADYPSDKLCNYLQEMERGGLFAQLGIRNFLEGDFFGWYLDTWDEGLDLALRRLIGDLANYSLVTLDIDPEETRDLLKQLYQNLMPKKLRHALGEYYTPDWLAERLLNQLGYEGDPRKRLLDPACGSGTFLVLAIKRIRKYADDKMLPPASVLEQVLTNVVGYDLNPLAVISARANYLLALGDLLESRRGEITIPIYLCDSILTPSQGTDLFTQSGYGFNTAVGRFSVPRSLVQAHYIDQLADLLEECIHINASEEIFRFRFLKTFPLDNSNDEKEIELAIGLFRQLVGLEAQGINGIWARIIKNAFAPLFQGSFDYIAGNPPWVNWESLPREYREETLPLWEAYGLYVSKGQLGKMKEGKKDLSMLMTYTAIDKYLCVNGKLGFIITQSVFKTAGAGQGFRRFRLGNRLPFNIEHIDDLSRLQPFEGATNRTAVMILQKGDQTNYPVPYTIWKKSMKRSSISEKDPLTNISIKTRQLNFIAEPIDSKEITSSWITGKKSAVKAARKIIGRSDYQARMGVNTGGANGVYLIDIINNLSDGLLVISNVISENKRKVDQVQMVIETDYVFPLLRGKDIRRWKASSDHEILIVQDRERQREGLSENLLKENAPKTYKYLSYFEKTLASRPDRKFYPDNAPFYTLRNVADYTFSTYKVVWSRVDDDITGAVVGGREIANSIKPVIPIETATFIPINNLDEAHYVCAIINSKLWRFVIASSSVPGTGGFGSPNVLEKARVPRFEPQLSIHKRLAALSLLAHQDILEENDTRIRDLEAEIDSLASQLWGISEDELTEIQESLKEIV